MFKPITKFRYFSQAVLPTAYQNSLSYLEDVDKLWYSVNRTVDAYNELIGYYNSLGDLLKEMEDKLSELDDKFIEIDNKLAQFETRFTQLQTDINNQFADLETNINTRLDTVINQINQRLEEALEDTQGVVNDMLKTVQEAIAQMKVELTENNRYIIGVVEARLDEFIRNIPDVQNVLVNNPVTGKVTTIDEALKDLMGYLNFFAMTSEEYDHLHMTSTEYDTKFFRGRAVTSTRYDKYARWIYGKPITRYIASAFVRGKQLLAREISFITSFLQQEGTFTSEEYDTQNFNSSVYDSKNMTSTQYDWGANRFLPERITT